MELTILAGVIRFASVAFQELLTCTQSLKKLQISCVGYADAEFNAVQIATITSGFANNTTLSDLELDSWGEADLAPSQVSLDSKFCCVARIRKCSGQRELSINYAVRGQRELSINYAVVDGGLSKEHQLSKGRKSLLAPGRLSKEHQLSKGRKSLLAPGMVTGIEVLGSTKPIHSAAESLSKN
jgi:hypothetical protein